MRGRMGDGVPYEGFEDYYKILGLHYPSDQEEIEAAFLRLAYTGDPDADKVETAFEILGNKELKEHYDFYYEQYQNGEIYATCGPGGGGCGCPRPAVSDGSPIKRTVQYGLTVLVLLALGLLWLARGFL